jgi:hypothetical protein
MARMAPAQGVRQHGHPVPASRAQEVLQLLQTHGVGIDHELDAFMACGSAIAATAHGRGTFMTVSMTPLSAKNFSCASSQLRAIAVIGNCDGGRHTVRRGCSPADTRKNRHVLIALREIGPGVRFAAATRHDRAHGSNVEGTPHPVYRLPAHIQCALTDSDTVIRARCAPDAGRAGVLQVTSWLSAAPYAVYRTYCAVQPGRG